MKHLLVLLLIFTSTISTAQTWVQPGATWFYEYEQFSTVCYGSLIKYHYENDVQIGGQLCQEFKQTTYSSTWDPLDSTTTTIGYTYTSGDTVYYWHHDQFFVLFDFGAQIGDSWVISDSLNSNILNDTICGDTSSVTVTDIGTIQLDGSTYRTITLKKDTLSPYILSGTYIERFGKINNSSDYSQHFFIFPQSDIQNCIPHIIIDWCSIYFDCYFDNSFSLNPSGGCGYSVGTKEYQENTYSIYPNPVNSDLKISLKDISDDSYIIIYNALGENKYNTKITSTELHINVEHLRKGIYFIKVYTNNNVGVVKKFIKA